MEEEEWEKVTIGDICDSVSSTYRGMDDEVVLVNTSDVLNGKILNHKSVHNQNLKGQFKKTFQKDDILYSEIRPANKRFAFIDFEDTNSYIASTKLMVLRPDQSKVLPRFLFAILTSDSIIMELQHLAETRSGTFPQITFSSELAPMPILLPNFDTQKRIVKILEGIDNKITINAKINQNLEEQAQALYKAWFLDFEPFKGIVPADWKPVTLGDVAAIKTDTFSPARNPDVLVEHYSIPAYDESRYPIFESASEIKSNKYILTPMSVMISKLNPDTKRIWRPMCITDASVSSTEFIVYESYNPAYKDFLYSVLDSIPFFHYLCAHTTGSTNSRQRATPKATLDFPLLLPPDSVIKRFCNIVSPMYDLISANIIENQSLSHTRNCILPKLMSGELDVSSLNI